MKKAILCNQVKILTKNNLVCIDEVLDRINEKFQLPQEHRWIGTDQAMEILQVKSKTTLLQLRTEGKIRYSQPQHKIILYDRTSLIEYIEKNARETF